MCNNGCVLLSQTLSYRVRAVLYHRVQCGACSLFSVVNSPPALSRCVNRRAEVQQHHLDMRCYGYEIRNTPRTNGISIYLSNASQCCNCQSESPRKPTLTRFCHMSSTKVPSQWCSTHLASAEPHGHGGSPQITTSHVKT